MGPVYLLVLVLGCSLLEGQSVRVNGITLNDYEDKGGWENEILAENPTIEVTTTTSTQKSCQPDIHSVLREMSAVLAELKVAQRHTTTAVNNLESRLRTSESQVEELKKKSEEELKDLKISFGREVENLKKESKDLKNAFGSEVENQKKENNERKIAFSASLSGGESGNTGPYSTEYTLVYKHIFTNIGKAYNPATGIFTAPVRGVYQFRFHIFGGSGRDVTVVLHKNGHHIAGTHAYQSGGTVSSSKGVSLLLEVGDVVCVKVRANAWVFDDPFHHTTFSGEIMFSV